MASKTEKTDDKLSKPHTTPGKVSKDDTRSDASKKDLDEAANAGAEYKARVKAAKKAQKANEPNRKPLKEGEHLPGADFRTQVENTAAGDLNMDPREPYPTGNPPDPRESFHRIHGHYPADESGGKDAQARQMDADPKT